MYHFIIFIISHKIIILLLLVLFCYLKLYTRPGAKPVACHALI